MKQESANSRKAGLLEILTESIRRSSWVNQSNDQVQNEKPQAELIEQFLRGRGLRHFRQNVKGNRFNVIIANSERPEILFTAHLDTVQPSDGWEPFAPKIKRVGGKTLVYGCGAVDMKGGLAAVVSALLRRGNSAGKPFAALFYCGEETGDFIGMKSFIAQTKIRPKLVVNVEPTGCEVIHSCRGVLTFELKVRGKTGHGSNPQSGVNAIQALIEAGSAVEEYLSDFGQAGVLGESTMNLAGLRGGTFCGGEILSIANKIPDYAVGKIEIRRTNRAINREKISRLVLAKLKSRGAQLEDYSILVDAKPMLSEIDFSALPRLVKEKPLADMKFGGYFDTQLLNEAWGTSCLIFGPGPVKMMHQTNEYVIFEQVEETREMIESFLV